MVSVGEVMGRGQCWWADGLWSVLVGSVGGQMDCSQCW